MADDDRRRNAEQTRSPNGEDGGLPCKEHDCPWQQQVEEQGIENPYQRILQRHQGWRSHHRNLLCKSVQPIAVIDIDLQVDPQHDQDRRSQQHEPEERHWSSQWHVYLFIAAQKSAVRTEQGQQAERGRTEKRQPNACDLLGCLIARLAEKVRWELAKTLTSPRQR